MYRMYDMIMKKRNGAEHTADEIRFIVEGFTKGEIPDYQMSAWLMCVYYKGMTHDETCALTHAMAESGDQLSLAAIHGVPEVSGIRRHLSWLRSSQVWGYRLRR